MQWRYDDQESSYEQHMQDRRKLNTKLSTLSHKYSDNEPYTMSVNEASTDQDSSRKNNNEEAWDNQPNNFFQQNEDQFSMNSFNSSMNFAKL